ncbi:hypothetical protein ULMS_19830 [Patiriisocius marinistellae]|uniref:Hydrolase n=1 Tax=Patiriisocius marinistellae TaxID=2494560 RepID=A0A5J4G1U8_9FLAO|nr:DUF5916 domain-containing protein [Patiriisocius marinistellae]GEQ86475.1 hypothetical protein ULMS_19830 [Patiriisocius marinistellae]
MRQPLLLLLLLISAHSFSQSTKSLQAIKISEAPIIDGILNDNVWENIDPSGNFYNLEPSNEGLARDSHKTEVKLAYDDKAVYVAAYLYDPNPDNIASQFSQRDDTNAQADIFTVALNTYNDGINETRFFVTSAGTIADSRVSQNRQDFNFNVVFQARVSRDKNGWYAEFKIPYNALRFPEIEVQDWSINFYRRVVNINETYTWNRIDKEVGRETQYNGPVYGVRDINPPTRLTFYPFAQGVVSSFDGETITNLSAGLDIKYGLSDSFTLDATLIPDFGQTAFDEVTLNLGPFEQTFGERRQFFTEGTELFNKGGIFFSRRIGGKATISENDFEENEDVNEYPKRVNLLNAIKISGRTKDNLGIGILNTITENTAVLVTDTITGVVREVVIEPLTNYNVFVLDQQFNGNSSISLTNTNVTRDGHFRDGNATALAFDVSDSGNRYNVSGRGIVSNVNGNEGNISGFRSELDLASIKGKFRYRVGHDFANTTYDINDLGLSRRNNYNNFVAAASYEIFDATKTFNKYRFNFTYRHERLYDPSVQTEDSYRFNYFFSLPSRDAFGGFFDYRSERQDYFEPRVDGKFVTFANNVGGNAFISTDYRRKIAFDINIGFRNEFDGPQRQLFLEFSPRYRFSDNFAVVVNSELANRNNQFGYIDNTDTDVFFGQRDIKALENSIRGSYNFDPYKAIDLRFRNFWTVVDYSDDIYFKLNDNGTRTIIEYDTSDNNPNTNFNIWNLDISYRWRFAPGSEATLLYRNQIFKSDEQATIDYTQSLGNLFEEAIQHTVSLRVSYFIDYNNIKYLFKKDS